MFKCGMKIEELSKTCIDPYFQKIKKHIHRCAHIKGKAYSVILKIAPLTEHLNGIILYKQHTEILM